MTTLSNVCFMTSTRDITQPDLSAACSVRVTDELTVASAITHLTIIMRRYYDPSVCCLVRWFVNSDGVLDDVPWPRKSSRTHFHVLGLGLGLVAYVLALALNLCV